MSHPEDIKQRRCLRVRCWRRGMREMDLLLGPFADATIMRMTSDELAILAAFLGESDQDLFQWIMEKSVPQENTYTSVISALRRFHGLEPSEHRKRGLS